MNHHTVASELIRVVAQTCRAIDALGDKNPRRAEVMTHDLEAALDAVKAKLGKIKAPPVRAGRWQGIPRPNQLSGINGRSRT